MKKTLSVLAVLGIVACTMPSAQAFTWSNLNPATWFGSGKCGCEKPKCREVKQCDPCATGYAAPCEPKAPCDPCHKQKKICDPCDRLQNMNK